MIRLALYHVVDKVRDVGIWLIDLGEDIHAWADARTFQLEKKEDLPRRLQPAEQILLASIVGLAICGLWIAITWRAWT